MLFKGTGRGGASIYGKTFADEIHSDLKHMGKTKFLSILIISKN